MKALSKIFILFNMLFIINGTVNILEQVDSRLTICAVLVSIQISFHGYKVDFVEYLSSCLTAQYPKSTAKAPAMDLLRLNT